MKCPVESQPGGRTEDSPPAVTIAIVGGGVSGSLLASHLLARATAPIAVMLVEKRPAIGSGTAYSTGNPAHLLNVRAANMSAFEDDPDHFLRWLRDRPRNNPDAWNGGSFVPRRLFGAYAAEVLDHAEAASPAGARLIRVQAAATGLAETQAGLVLRLDNGAECTADTAVLCLGNFPPAPPARVPGLVQAPGFLGDPWDWGALNAIQPDDPVLLIGTGLTMVDVLLDLERNGHRGAVLALSRHGLLPRTHAPSRPKPPIETAEAAPTTARALMTAIRAAAHEAEAAGDGWRATIDGLRPFTQAIWRRLPDAEQRRFLRHVQPWWDVHRHRIAPEIAVHVTHLRASGRLTVEAGRLAAIAEEDDGLSAVRWLPRTGTEAAARTFAARWIVNCTGALCDYNRIRDPLVRNMIALGRARPDPLRLGLDVTEDGAVREESGRTSERIFALGPPTRGAFWEITAVPDIRKAAERLARHLLAQPCGPTGWGDAGAPKTADRPAADVAAFI